MQAARGHESVAAVVAFATTDYDGTANAEAEKQLGSATAGVFHEHDAGNAGLFNRPAVDCSDLVTR